MQVMRDKYIVWIDGDQRTDGQIIEANDHSTAARVWARLYDERYKNSERERLIRNGYRVRLHVAAHRHSEARTYDVEGELMPVYYTFRVVDKSEDE